MPDQDPWADEPDRFDEADREWAQKWADRDPDDDAEPVEPPPGGYRNKRVTPGSVHDAYGDGMREAGAHLGTGMQIAASMLLFVGLGLLVDRWLDTSPWGVVVGAVLGMVGILALVLRMAREE
ncbi:AtpZ/AtpI family protein [Rubrivirga sp.]|uniref:AtpZ/AtpI family protein n=1 Tax=Rubrivirga sp. TaxID=1885344 RepID=UPI003B52FA97